MADVASLASTRVANPPAKSDGWISYCLVHFEHAGEAVEFDDPAYFSRVYAAATGLSARAFRDEDHVDD